MSNVSQELVFALTKKNSRFHTIRKVQQFGGSKFTSEPFNLTQKISFKYSGVRDQAIDLHNSSTGSLVCKRKKTGTSAVAKGITKASCKPRGFNKRAKWAARKIGRKQYRGDLLNKVILRVAVLNAASHRRKPKAKQVKDDKKVVAK